jgi:hypothetical protein
MPSRQLLPVTVPPLVGGPSLFPTVAEAPAVAAPDDVPDVPAVPLAPAELPAAELPAAELPARARVPTAAADWPAAPPIAEVLLLVTGLVLAGITGILLGTLDGIEDVMEIGVVVTDPEPP